MVRKRLIITSVISIILISILFIGSTYSIFTTGEVDENQNVYTTGNLSVDMSSNGIVIEDNVPVSDDRSNTVTPTRITVTNNGTVSYKFNLILTDTTSSNSISSEYIKTKVGVLNPVRLSDTTDNIIKSDIVVGAGSSVDIDVRVWLSDDIPSSELGKNFYAKLTIDGIAVYNDDTEVDNNDLSIAYMKTLFTSSGDYSYFRSDDYIEKIKNVSFVNYIDLDDVAVDSSSEAIKWDVTDTTKSDEGTVVAWLEDSETNGFYDLYIGSEKLIFVSDMSYFFRSITLVDSIDFSNLDTSLTTNMKNMFYKTGSNNTVFTLDLGDKFDTSNVTDMEGMFNSTGYSSTVFTLDLGSNFDTSNVTNMHSMFCYTGYKSTVFTLDLGSNFDTSNVTDMYEMFSRTGYNSTVFTLDLGDKFDTSNVTNMSYMFAYTGDNSKVFTLDLGDKFDTSNVTNMGTMFEHTGYYSPVFTLDLGDKFDTSNVTSMAYMFNDTGYSSTVFTLDLGDKFDTSNVTNMYVMFNSAGYSSTVFTLDLGDKFDTSNVTDMRNMFNSTGYSSTVFTLDLGDKFDTSSVTGMWGMFDNTGYSSTVFTLDLGDKFDTSNVTSMSSMFYNTGYSSTVFTLDLGDKFDTSNITYMGYMFYQTGYANNNLVLDLSTFDFTNVTSYDSMFYGFKTTKKVYVKDTTAQTWILDKGFSNMSTDNVLIK